MGVNETNKNDKATIWSIVIKAAYRKRRSKKRQVDCEHVLNENSDTQGLSGDDLLRSLNGSRGSDGLLNNSGNHSASKDECYDSYKLDVNRNDNGGSCDDLLKALLQPCKDSNDLVTQDKTAGNNSDSSDTLFSGEKSSFLSELFSTDKLSGNGGSKLSLDCKGEIIIEDTSLMSNSGRQMDWLGLMEGRVYINENMAGTCLQPYSGAYRRTKSKRWSLEQTEKFYDALSLFGTDLMLVKSVFPEFTDKQVHDKFKAEERKNKDKLDNILINNKKKLTREDIDKFNSKYK